MGGAFALAFSLALGLALGSFIGLLWDRVPAGERVVGGRSRCDYCRRILNVVDLVPVAGYLLRRGRCAGCGAPISVRYPLLEAGCGALMLIAVALAGPLAGGAAGLAGLAVTAVAGLVVAFLRTDR